MILAKTCLIPDSRRNRRRELWTNGVTVHNVRYRPRCAACGSQFQTVVWLWHVRPGINATTFTPFEDIDNPKLNGGAPPR
jgi:hypothetical protein